MPKVSKKSNTATTKQKNNSVEDVEQRILTKLAERRRLGVKEVSKAEVLKIAGYSFPTAARFIAATKALKTKEFVGYNKESKSYQITEKGLAHILPESLGDIQQMETTPPTDQAYHEQLKEQLESPKAFEILEKLADGAVHNRLTVCNEIGYKYKTAQAFAKSVAELEGLGFLEAAGQGKFRLTDKAFPCARP